jgi:hypothetical protein
MNRFLVSLLLLVAVSAKAQTIFVVTNNYNDLNPERDALAMGVGGLRLTAAITDGADPLSFTGMSSAVLRVVSRIDGYTNHSLAAAQTNAPGTLRWIVPTLAAGEYRLQSTVVYPGESFHIFDRWLSVTTAPAANCPDVSIGATTITNIFNITYQVSNHIDNITQIVTQQVTNVISMTHTCAVPSASVSVTNTTWYFDYCVPTGDVTNVLSTIYTNTGCASNVVWFTVTNREIQPWACFPALAGGGSQTPWTGTVNAASNSVTNIGVARAQAFYGGQFHGGIGSNRTAFIGGGQWGYIDEALNPYMVICGGESNRTYFYAYTGSHIFMGGGKGNVAEGQYAVLVGGLRNWMDYIQGKGSFLGAGQENELRSGYGLVYANFLGGGWQNRLMPSTGNEHGYSVLVGGEKCHSYGSWSFLGGGGGCRIGTNYYAVVPGGYSNSVFADFGFAAGREAVVLHRKSFVWNSADQSFATSATNQYLVNVPGGGVGVNTSNTPAPLSVGGPVLVGSSTSGYAAVAGMIAFDNGTFKLCATNGVWSTIALGP